MRVATPEKKPKTSCLQMEMIEMLSEALDKALTHLDYCGWGDAWEREVSEELQEELPAVLETAEKYIAQRRN